MGRSVIVHAKEDDMKTDPAGNAGDRIAGGKIEAAEAK
jgi:Cu-Zn family superoxide dismutase